MTESEDTGAAAGWGALEGVRVLDLTQSLAGPFCTQILADHGARVIKVESPDGGDLARTAGPYHPDDVQGADAGYFHSINRNKESVALDLKASQGQEVFLRLADRSDIVVENFRAGTMDKLGLGYEALAVRNPRIIYGAIRGFGDPRTGRSPYVDWPAYDVVAQAMGGICGITGPDADNPTKIGPGIGDHVPGLFLAIGLLAALHKRGVSGRGQFVDVSMVDAILAITERIVYQHSFAGVVPRPQGNHQPFFAPFGLYPAKDGHVALAATSDPFFERLCTALDARYLLADARFATQAARGTIKPVIEAVSALTRRFTKAELAARLGGIVPFGPVYAVDDIVADPHFVARDMLPRIEIPGIRQPLAVAGTPIKMTASPGRIERRAPRLGEDSTRVLRELGYTSAAIDSMLESGALVAPIPGL